MTTQADPIDVLALTAELMAAGVAGVTIGHVDFNGIPRARTVPIAALPRIAEIGVGISPVNTVFTSLDAITYDHEDLSTPSGDVRLIPVLDGIVALAGQPALAWAPGRIVTVDGTPWPYDSRSVLERQVEALAAVGFTALAGYELEFAAYLDGPADLGSPVPAIDGPAYSPHTLIPVDDFIAAVLRDCAANGLDIGQLHAEYGPAQIEISLGATDPVRAADRQLLARQTLHAAARRHGLRLSFAPLPSGAAAGNGWHLHTSIWRDGKNLLAGGPDGPGPGGRGYVAGLLRDLPALAAITAPSFGSLARLRPGYFAGAYACWGVENREAPLRYVRGSALLGADHANIELKTSDAAANPYLALAAVLASGAAGVRDDPALPPPVQLDPAAVGGLARMPATPAELEAALTGNGRIAGVLGPELLGAYLAVRRADAASAQDHEQEAVLESLRWRY